MSQRIQSFKSTRLLIPLEYLVKNYEPTKEDILHAVRLLRSEILYTPLIWAYRGLGIKRG